MKTESEKLVSAINSNVFFKEFTFSKNDFTDLTTNQKLEFSDNVVWLDDIFFLIQIKERDSNGIHEEEKWFDNKVLRKAVKQIKNSHGYLRKYPSISIVNEKGHSKNIAEANFSDIQNIVVYLPTPDFKEEKRFVKFYKSEEVGLIHLFHSEDYHWVCKYLLTPAEVKEYLLFREDLYLSHSDALNQLPEQYVLGHFLEILETEVLKPSYIENLKIYQSDLFDFNMSHLIDNFNKNIKLINGQTEYYPIIAEIAKLKRTELAEFKKRYLRAIEKCQEEDNEIPYRMYIPRTDCAFVFIPLTKKSSQYWRNALTNFTFAQKYDQKATKCVGLVIFESLMNKERYFEFYWMYLDEIWVYDDEMEEVLKRSFPFREVKTKQFEHRYLPKK